MYYPNLISKLGAEARSRYKKKNLCTNSTYIYILKTTKLRKQQKNMMRIKKIHRIYFNCMPIHTFLTYFNSIQVLVVEQTNTNKKKSYTSSFSRFHFNTQKKTYENWEGLNFGSTNSKANKKENNNNSILSIHSGTLQRKKEFLVNQHIYSNTCT